MDYLLLLEQVYRIEVGTTFRYKGKQSTLETELASPSATSPSHVIQTTVRELAEKELSLSEVC